MQACQAGTTGQGRASRLGRQAGQDWLTTHEVQAWNVGRAGQAGHAMEGREMQADQAGQGVMAGQGR